MKFTKSPLVIIGFDGCDWELINPWIDDGKLPNIRRIKREGISSNMVSTIPPITGPALASFFTGMNPDNTGIIGMLTWDYRIVTFNDIKEPAIWDYLGEAGIRACVVGLRFTHPAKEINGIMVSEGLNYTKKGGHVKPTKYLDKCKGYQPDPATYPVLCSTMKKGIVEDPKIFTDEAISLTKKQFSIFLDLRSSEEFPFSLFWVEQTDILQHFCWDRPEQILRLYQSIDALIGEFLEENPDINLIIMSDHGFHPIPSKNFYINGWLMEKGYLKPDPHILKNSLNMARKHIKALISRAISLPTKKKLLLFWEFISKNSKPAAVENRGNIPIIPPLSIAAQKYNFDPDSAIAYSFNPWGIQINTKFNNRDRQSVREKLISEMKTLFDKEGRPVFKYIVQKEEICSGKYFDDMPDIFFLVQDHFHVETFLRKKRFGRYINPYSITGSHDQAYNGIMMAYGKMINKNFSLDEIRIIDFLPTILDYFRIFIPENIDGESKAGMFGIDKHSGKSIKVAPRLEMSKDRVYTSDEEAEIKERLKNLGYL